MCQQDKLIVKNTLMKRIILPLLLCLSSYTLVGQAYELYALAGPVLNQIDGDRLGGYDNLGAVAGIGVYTPLSESWKGMLELEYINKGSGSFDEASGASKKTALHYIQLPVIVEYNINDKFFVETGLSIAYLMGYQLYEDGHPSSFYTGTFKNFDFQWLCGGSYALSEQWRVNMRFSYSIVPMGLTSDIESVYRPNFWKHPYGLYNRNLALAFQYLF
jgi:hypothetical protein